MGKTDISAVETFEEFYLTLDSLPGKEEAGHPLSQKDRQKLEYYRHRVGPINEERMQLIEKAVAEASPAPARLEGLVDALVMPLARRAVGAAAHNRREFKRMQLFFAEDLRTRLLLKREIFDSLFKRFLAELQRTLPEIPGIELNRRLYVATGCLMGTCARLDIVVEPRSGEPSEAAMWDIIHTLRDGLYGVFRAPFRASLNEQVFIEDKAYHRFVPMNTIARIVADGNYSSIYFNGGGTAHIHRTMKAWEALLPAGKFLRVHRNCLVNRASISRWKRLADGRLNLSLLDEERPCLVSRRKSSRILKDLESRDLGIVRT